MEKVLTFLAALFGRGGVRLHVRLDHSGVGAHLIWTITNGTGEPITVRRLVFRGAHGVVSTVPLDPPRTIAPQAQIILPIDVDWNLLGAHEIAAVDADDRSHAAPSAQLAQVQQRLRQTIDRRRSAPVSASAFLHGAADLAFGAMILGLGFFMLMYVIATG
jgi:hypothetical protein